LKFILLKLFKIEEASDCDDSLKIGFFMKKIFTDFLN